MAYAGFIDTKDNWTLHGWAFASATPDTPVEVEFILNSGLRTTALANSFRSDLLAAGFGNGCHGFSVRLPTSVMQEGPHTVSARIRGTDFFLSNSPFPVSPGYPVEVVAGDIVNNCNLRCPFCITDYQLVRGLKLMTASTFAQSTKLMPLVCDGGFWLSCMHEPTLHPDFATFVESVPAHLRKKISFTTNLCKRIPLSTLERLAQSGIHSIRVSLDTLEPTLFETLRKGAKFSIFSEQLHALSTLLRKIQGAPRLDFISVVLKENADQIRPLVRTARERFGSSRHEIRYMYYSPHLAEWGLSHVLELDRWHELKQAASLENPGFPISIGDPPPDVIEKFTTADGVSDYERKDTVFGGSDINPTYRKADPLISGFLVPDSDLRLRLRWDGVMMVEQIPESQFHCNVSDLDDPADYFNRLRSSCLRVPMKQLGVWSSA